MYCTISRQKIVKHMKHKVTNCCIFFSLISLFLSLSIYLSIYLYIYLFIYMYTCMYIYIIYVYIYIYIIYFCFFIFWISKPDWIICDIKMVHLYTNSKPISNLMTEYRICSMLSARFYWRVVQFQRKSIKQRPKMVFNSKSRIKIRNDFPL